MHQLGFDCRICVLKGSSVFQEALFFISSFQFLRLQEKIFFHFSCPPSICILIRKKSGKHSQDFAATEHVSEQGALDIHVPIFCTATGILYYITEMLLTKQRVIADEIPQGQRYDNFFLCSEVSHCTLCSSVWEGKTLQGLKGGWEAGG